ncbi:MAG: YARHG domain-containing protein, partial [Defluviitaleaceae bacterium]|nr:YARHG domain-containing protein [Defluviitaleaceae bacterium]
MICRNCNAQLASTAAFCNKCGTKTTLATAPKTSNTKVIIISVVITTLLLTGGTISFLAFFNSQNNGATAETIAQTIIPETPAQTAAHPTEISTEETTEETVENNENNEEPAATANPEQAIQAATEFLSGFTTLFLDWDEKMGYMSNLLEIDRNDFSAWENIIFGHFSQPNLIANLANNPSFNGLSNAGAFSLLEVDNSGIPLIAIHFENGFHEGSWAGFSTEIFQYINGEYLQIDTITDTASETPLQFFRNTAGQLLLYEEGFPSSFNNSISYITITPAGILREQIVEWDFQDEHLFDSVTELGPGVSLSGLTSLRMESLEEQIRANATPIAQARFNEIVQNAQNVQNVQSVPAAPPAAATAPDTGLIFASSDSQLIDESSLMATSTENLRIARNEIFARHGRLFVAEDLQSHFNSLPWYNGTIAPADFTESML